MLVWDEFGVASDGSGSVILARLYSETGKPFADSFRLNEATEGDPFNPAVVNLTVNELYWSHGRGFR